MIQANLLPPQVASAQIRTVIGLISDTHIPERYAALPETVLTIFRGVDLILHAGDVGDLVVLDQLSQCAPVIAVHGNDEPAAIQRELPYQQVVTVAGQRILLWHSHYVDRVDELDSRRGDELLSKLGRSVQRAKRADATVAVFGHWHIPLLYEAEGVLVINPGAIAASSIFTRQVRQTVALLFLLADGSAQVRHVDLAEPTTSFPLTPLTREPGFAAAASPYSASILSPALQANFAALRAIGETITRPYALPPFLRVAHRCWAGQQAEITYADLLAEVEADEELPTRIKERYLALLRALPIT